MTTVNNQIKTYTKDGIKYINVPEGYTGWQEPTSSANDQVQPIYPYNHVMQTESGHSFEMDDTPTRERIRLQHRSGTFIEMHPDGDEVHKVYGNGYEITVKDKNVLVEGVCRLEVNGDCEVHVRGNKIETVEGNYELRVMGDHSVTVEQSSTMYSVGNMNITAGAGLRGKLSINTGNHLILDGKLTVNGELIAEKITSHTRVDAKGGMRAGAQGFVTPNGGISVGFPTPLAAYAKPGKFTIAGDILVVPSAPLPGDLFFMVPPTPPGLGSVTALIFNGTLGNILTMNSILTNSTTVNATLGNFSLSDSILMTDIVNTTVYDSHIHYVGGKGGGVTTTPIGPMV